MQRRHGKAVTEGCGRPFDIRPAHRHQRRAGFGQLKLQALGEAQLLHKVVMGDIRHTQRQLHRPDIRRMNDNLARGQRAFFAMHIIDGRRANLQRGARIEGFIEFDLAAFQSHRRGHDFENRAQFINAHGHGVEVARQGRGRWAVNVKIGQRHQCENFAIGRVHQNGTTALGRKFANRRRQAFTNRMLNADVERCLKYRRHLHLLVQTPFQPHQPLHISACKTNHMRGNRPARIHALGFAPQFQPRISKLKHGALLQGRKPLAQFDIVAVARQQTPRALGVYIRQNPA